MQVLLTHAKVAKLCSGAFFFVCFLALSLRDFYYIITFASFDCVSHTDENLDSLIYIAYWYICNLHLKEAWTHHS